MFPPFILEAGTGSPLMRNGNYLMWSVGTVILRLDTVDGSLRFCCSLEGSGQRGNLNGGFDVYSLGVTLVGYIWRGCSSPRCNGNPSEEG